MLVTSSTIVTAGKRSVGMLSRADQARVTLACARGRERPDARLGLRDGSSAW